MEHVSVQSREREEKYREEIKEERMKAEFYIITIIRRTVYFSLSLQSYYYT